MTPKTRSWSAARPVFLGCLTLLFLFGGIGSWSILTTLSGAIVAPGQIEVAQNRQVVQHPDGGVVAEIDVVEGQAVAAGDILIRLDGKLLKSELSIVENQLFELFARRARLEAERDDDATITFSPELIEVAKTRPEVLELKQGQAKLFEARKETLAQKTGQLGKRVEQISDQIAGIGAQNASLATQVSTPISLARTW